MTVFPEEQLDSPTGYFLGYPGLTLQSGKWTIVRKLGWGERSSVWLVHNTSNVEEFRAIKIFTVNESKGTSASNELRNLGAEGIGNVDLAQLQDSFHEGDHLCLVFNPHGITIEHLRRSNTAHGYVAVHIAKQVASWTLAALLSLQDVNLVHNAIATDHIVVGELDQDYIQEAEPAIATEFATVNGVQYPIVKSQPIDPKGWDTKWDQAATDFAGKTLSLLNIGHAVHPTENTDTITRTKSVPLGPEVVLGHSIGFSSDIWQLGWMIFLLISGTPLVDQGVYVHSPVESITQALKAPDFETRLARNATLARNELVPTASLLRSLLAVEPSSRPSLDDLLDSEWVQQGDVCSCGWCQADTGINKD